MYITVNKEQIDIRLNPYIYVNVLGPDPLYYVELREYINNEEESRLIEGHHLNKNGAYVQSLNFSFFGEFYGDYEISVYKFVKNVGLQKIHTHRYNDCGKLVEFYLETNSIDDANTWVESILEYQKKHGCIVKLNSSFDELNNRFEYDPTLPIYKTYNIGRFEKTSTDYKTLGETRKHGNIWFGNWKVFWSYQHPRNWKGLSSKNISDDILGLT
jgi:hypothetical protein